MGGLSNVLRTQELGSSFRWLLELLFLTKMLRLPSAGLLAPVFYCLRNRNNSFNPFIATRRLARYVFAEMLDECARGNRHPWRGHAATGHALRAAISASSAAATRHHSEAGSACAMLPQNVPRVRIG